MWAGEAARNRPVLTVFESGLLALNIRLINSRLYRLQTSGRMEWFHKSLEADIWNYHSLDGYVEYHNIDWLHFSLDVDDYEISMMAFSKSADEGARRHNPN